MDEDKITINLLGTKIDVDAEGYENIDGAFTEFLRQVAMSDDSELSKGKTIYIGYWGSQGGFKLEPEFISTAHHNGWNIEIDFND